MAVTANEVQERRNRVAVAVEELIRSIKAQGIAIVISATSLFVTVVALLIAGLAITQANKASVRSEMQTEQINALREEVAVLEIRVINAEKDE